ncbi:MAG: (2Fe-2S) ferredoxin domain-containing protein [Clostridiaceae bacterium]
MVKLNVCIGSACHIKGSYNIIQTFQQLLEERRLHDSIEFKASFCMKSCNNSGVSVSVNGENYDVRPERAEGFFDEVVIPLLGARKP